MCLATLKRRGGGSAGKHGDKPTYRKGKETHILLTEQEREDLIFEGIVSRDILNRQ